MPWKMINVTRGLLHVVAVILLGAAVSAVEINISPDVPELTLTSGADLTLMCTGDVPVKWNVSQYDYNLLKEKDSLIDISQGLANNSYISQLSLSRASYLDTGFYYCDPLSEGSEVDKQNSKSIYIYVQHNTHLLAIPEDLVILSQDEFGNVIIPCRPTSPDVNVTLYKDEEEVTENVDYDQKIGYKLRAPSVRDSGLYNCEANRNDIEETRSLSVKIYPKVHKVAKPYIKSSDVHSNHVIVGQNLRLNCSINMDIGISYTLHWKVPDDQKIKTGHVQVGKEYFFDGLKHGVGKNVGSRLLNIQNVSTEDEGNYICEVIVHSGHKNEANYKLNVFTPNATYLNLTVQGVSEIKRRAGYSHVQWIIQVSAYPIPTLVWRDPEGKDIGVYHTGMKQEKITVENDKSTSKLVIKDLQLYDSGVYELIADNGAHKKQITVTLLVEDKPLVEINRSREFYKEGEVYNVECNIAGYPLPEVEWSFKKCSKYPECEELFTKISRDMYKETVLRESFLTSVLNITATETGILLCNATNFFGNDNHNSTFLVTDIPNGLDVIGPSLVVEGDNITIRCGASKYNYHKNIKWIHQAISSEEDSIKNNTELFSTKFSYHSAITIKNITNKFDGKYLCIVIDSNDQNIIKKSYSLKVNNAVKPIISKSSNSSNWRVKTGTPVQWGCFVSGMPPPSVSWLKNGKPLNLHMNDTRVFLIDRNQSLIIRFTAFEDEGEYVCNATNRIGNDISTNFLTIIDKPLEHEHFGFIAFFSVLIILLGILMIGCAFRLKRERKLNKELAQAGLLNFERGAVESWNPDLGIEAQAELLPYDKRWEFPREKLKLGKQLGSGAFGVVFKADAIGIIDKDTTTTVAVKMVKPNTDPSYIRALASELKIMVHLGRHLNVVNLLGAYTGNINKRELMVIVEYCRFGNIHQYLLKQRDCFINQITPVGHLDYNIKTISKNPYYENVPNKTDLSEKCDDSNTQIGSDGYLVPDINPEWCTNYRGDYKNLITKPICTHDLICWSFQVARGMEYLASRNILHGDLATRNILLAEENIVKICDFGFAKALFDKQNYQKTSTKDLLPIKWLAIESLRDQVFSTQSDVWSFGIVLWEMFSLAVTPYPNIQNCNDLFHKLVEGYRMEQPKYANSEIYNLMLDCWKMNPINRPSFTDLAEFLGDLLEDGTKSHYMNLNEVYMRMNTEGSPSTDYLSLLTAPTYLNCSTISNHNSNSCPDVSEHSDEKVDLELRPMLHNSVESSGYVNLTKPSYFSNPNYDVMDKSKNYSYIQSPCPSYV